MSDVRKGIGQMKCMPVLSWINASLVLVNLSLMFTACQPRTAQDSNMYRLRSEQPDFEATRDQIVTALFEQLKISQALPQGYPQLGALETQPDVSDPAIQVMRCTPGAYAESDQADCIQMNAEGDFLRAQAITWESAAFFMYRIYITSKSPFARVNLAKDFVALDVFLQADPSLWETIDEIIHFALV